MPMDSAQLRENLRIASETLAILHERHRREFHGSFPNWPSRARDPTSRTLSPTERPSRPRGARRAAHGQEKGPLSNEERRVDEELLSIGGRHAAARDGYSGPGRPRWERPMSGRPCAKVVRGA